MRCLKKRVWNIWKWALLFRHAVRDNAPTLLYCIFCIQAFVIYETDFYSDYYKWFDYLDTLVYLLIGYDVYKQLYDNYVHEKLFRYNELNAVACFLLFALLILNLIHSFFDLTDYIGFYKSILLGGGIGLFFTQIK